MLTIGLMGGVASGKSLVARLLEELGAARLDADRAGHLALMDSEIKAACREFWGESVFSEGGQIDRAALGRIVFGPSPDGPKDLARLERLTHPWIRKKLEEESQEFAAEGRKAVVLDAPLLLEAGWRSLCDHLVFVDAPREARLARALARNWTEQEFAAREAAQETLETKRAIADTIIDNSASTDSTRIQVERLWRRLAP